MFVCVCVCGDRGARAKEGEMMERCLRGKKKDGEKHYYF